MDDQLGMELGQEGLPPPESPLESGYEEGGFIDHEQMPADFDASQVDFYENLANVLPDQTLTKVAENLLDAIDEDLDARKEWSESLKTGLKYFGIKPDTKTFPFDGATGVYSPAFMQAALAFVSQNISELLPSKGPCLVKVLGESNPELDNQAERMETFVNYYCTNVEKEFASEIEKTILWSWFSGSGIVKVYKHPIIQLPTVDMIMPQDFIVAQNTKSLETSPRLTQCMYLTKKELRERQISGLYRDIKLSPSDSLEGDEDDLQSAVDTLSGISHESLEFDDEYILYECHADLDIEGLEHTDNEGQATGIPLPYIVTLDKNTRRVLSIYRNWKESDQSCQRINHFVDFIFQHGLEFYGWGMAHIAGGSAQAATTLIRQSIDSLTLSNFPGGLRAKGMRVEDNNIRVGPTEFISIDTGGLALRDVVMPMPYPQLNPLTLEIKKSFEDAIMQFSTLTNMKFDDISPNLPVGTIYALIEQSSKPQSGIMKRYHASLGRILKIMFRIFGECLPESPYIFKSYGNQSYTMAQDFNKDVDIIPASDPNLSSNMQRLIRSEAMLKLAQQAPQLHNMREIYERIYHEMRVDNIDKILIPEQQIKPLDPVTENANMLKGSPAKASIDQNHEAHLTTHSWLLADPTIAQQFPHVIPLVQAHMQEHTSLKYIVTMMQQMGTQLPEDPTQLPVPAQNQIAEQAASATQQMIQQAQEALKAQQPPQVDPTELVIADMKQRADYDQAKLQIEMEKLKLDKEKTDANIQIKIKELDQKFEMDRLNRDTEILKEQMKKNLPEVPLV